MLRSLSLFVAVATPLFAEEPAPEKIDLEKLLTVRKGTIPVIVSAPHGGRLPIPGVKERTGNGAEKFVVVMDTDTDKLAGKLATALKKEMGGEPYVVIAHFERKYVDANRPAEGAYESDKAKPVYDAYHKALKDACDEVRKDWGRGFLLDLHGQAAEKDTIFRGTNDGKTVKDLTDRFGKKALTGPTGLMGVLEKKGYTVVPAGESDDKEDRRYNGGYTVQHYGSSAGTSVDAVQFETGGTHRAKANLDKTAADFAAAIKVFAKDCLPAEKLKQR